MGTTGQPTSRLFCVTTHISSLFDTGSEVSVTPSAHHLPPDKLMLIAVNDTLIPTSGKRSLTLDLGLCLDIFLSPTCNDQFWELISYDASDILSLWNDDRSPQNCTYKEFLQVIHHPAPQYDPRILAIPTISCCPSFHSSPRFALLIVKLYTMAHHIERTGGPGDC